MPGLLLSNAIWEAENPDYGIVHHLMVLCYHLQHPSLYSPEGLDEGITLLSDFLERGLTPEQVRKRNRGVLSSSTRTWKITGTPASHGAYEYPITWTMTAANVIEGGMDNYYNSVRTWARSVLEALERA
jgi:Family of unknown function (DUF5946)